MALDASHVPADDLVAAEECMDEAVDQLRVFSSREWTYAAALTVQKLYLDILFFSEDMLKSALRRRIYFERSTVKRVPPGEPSASERTRVIKAFYRFQTHCSLFGIPTRIRPRKEQIFILYWPEIFLVKYQPWEIEQIACVSEHLYHRLSQAYDEAPVDKQNDQHGFSQDGLYEAKYSILIRGIQFLRELFGSGGSDARRLINDCDTVRYDLRTLLALSDEENIWGIWQVDFEAEMKYYNSLDEDNGPKYVWAWAHHDIERNKAAYCDSTFHLRQWAYVCWDLAHIQRWELTGDEPSRFDPEECIHVNEESCPSIGDLAFNNEL